MVSPTTFMLNPSILDEPSLKRPGMTFPSAAPPLPVPGFQATDVSIYPLSVVEDTAVSTWLMAISSAYAIEPRLMTPSEASASVQCCCFI